MFLVIAAAGKSHRFGGLKKQFIKIEGKFILEIIVSKFLKCGLKNITIATPKNDIEIAKNILYKFKEKIFFVKGEQTRQQTVKKAFLKAVEKYNKSKFVLIHDAARPFFDISAVKKLIETVKKTNAATLCCPVYDTVKYVDSNNIKKTLNREKIFLAQTPQAFSIELYKKALKFAEKNNLTTTDDCSLIEALNHKIAVVLQDKTNFKITTKEDLQFAEFLLKTKEQQNV